MTAPPGKGAPYGVFEAAYVPHGDVDHVAVLPTGAAIACGRRPTTPSYSTTCRAPALPEPLARRAHPRAPPSAWSPAPAAATRAGTPTSACGCATDDAWRWLAHELTVDRFRELLPETADLTVVRHVLPNLRALNFVVEGLLGEGVAAQARFDPQAKALGEWLRSRHLDIPEVLL